MPELYHDFYQAQRQLADIEAIDYFFAKEMSLALALSLNQETKLSSEQEQILFHLLMCLSISLRAGHTCLPITEIANINWGVAVDEQGQVSHQGYAFPTEHDLVKLLLTLKINANDQQVVVFSHGLLYMRRYYQFEVELAKYIKQRLVPQAVATEEVKRCLNSLFPYDETEQNEQYIDWQKVAVANAINKNFTVIAGGPGTGKTYTVTKLLAALLILSKTDISFNNKDDKQVLDIALVAPTGKAAQRLSESIM
ncbi:MAG: AAA family ATPase, partial [Colwellia sp.]